MQRRENTINDKFLIKCNEKVEVLKTFHCEYFRSGNPLRWDGGGFAVSQLGGLGNATKFYLGI